MSSSSGVATDSVGGADRRDFRHDQRAYRRGITPATARSILRQGAETQWDPRLVRLFLASEQGPIAYMAGPGAAKDQPSKLTQVRASAVIMGTLVQVENPKEPNRRELASIVHDFNDLLGVVLNFSILARENLLAADPPAGDQIQQALKYLDRIENAARGAVQLNKELGAQIPRKERPPQP